MKIGLNVIYCTPGNVGGTQTYAEHLMAGMAEIDADNQYVVYTNREGAKLDIPKAANFETAICPIDAKNLPRRYFFEQFVLPSRLKRDEIDVCFSLGYVCPLSLPCANVVNIHDLNFIALKEAMSAWKRLIFGWFVTQSAIRSDHVITVSEFSQSGLREKIGIEASKTTVTLLGPRTHVATSISKDELTQAYGLRAPYLIVFSSQSERKNIPRLLEAFASIRNEFPHDLVLVGHVPENGKLDRCIKDLRLADRVIVTGYVPDEHVMPLIAHADLFVFPSYYEGFGLPALDAQQAGTAVAAANAASLPEVAGDGAVYFDPFSTEDMTTVLRRCLSEPELRESLVAKGRNNLARFSWKTTALQTLEVMKRFG
ncbi:MAG: glycosyltransferase family 1 protein [Capsulimonadaceae bacterium]|nr:glycosyltransferase family 1 protein [Capsulimonadaceae bacterium]